MITAISYMSKNWNFAGRRPQYRSRYHGGGMWLCNGVHVVDRLTWMMASQAQSVSASIGTRAHYQAGDDSATAFIRYKNGLAGVAVSIGFADGAELLAGCLAQIRHQLLGRLVHRAGDGRHRGDGRLGDDRDDRRRPPHRTPRLPRVDASANIFEPPLRH